MKYIAKVLILGLLLVLKTNSIYAMGERIPIKEMETEKVYKLAKNGNNQAITEMADRYYEGWKIQKDHKKALEYYIKGADKGDGSVQFNLALMYDEGDAVSMNYKLAKYWYERAILQGHAGSMVRLGGHYQMGTGVTKNKAIAIDYFLKASDKGDAVGMVLLAKMAEEENDFTVAKKWYKKAAEITPKNERFYGTRRDAALKLYALNKKEGDTVASFIWYSVYCLNTTGIKDMTKDGENTKRTFFKLKENLSSENIKIAKGLILEEMYECCSKYYFEDKYKQHIRNGILLDLDTKDFMELNGRILYFSLDKRKENNYWQGKTDENGRSVYAKTCVDLAEIYNRYISFSGATLESETNYKKAIDAIKGIENVEAFRSFLEVKMDLVQMLNDEQWRVKGVAVNKK